MTRLYGLLVTGLVLMLSSAQNSWGQPFWNPTASDASENTAGGQAAFAFSGGASNTAFGLAVLGFNSGSFNTGIGARSLVGNSGDANTAIGYRALSHGVGFDSNHGDNNTASGAYSLSNNSGGSYNSATGLQALFNNTDGGGNTATGANALYGNVTGNDNTANGALALFSSSTGNYNTAAGVSALQSNIDGSKNTAIGHEALRGATGNQNIGIGAGAGQALTSGSKNIYLGHPGAASESNTMRLGNKQKKTYIAGVATSAITGGVVLIDATGRLGVQLSSARYKRDIETMGPRSAEVLNLRPVTFAYTEDPQGTRQYGLIAEEVAAVYPELVTRTPSGDVQAVRYQELIPMLLNEFQRQHRAVERQARELAELREIVGRITGPVAAQ